MAERLAAFPQDTMLSDRRAVLEGAGLPLVQGLTLEAQLGRPGVDRIDVARALPKTTPAPLVRALTAMLVADPDHRASSIDEALAYLRVGQTSERPRKSVAVPKNSQAKLSRKEKRALRDNEKRERRDALLNELKRPIANTGLVTGAAPPDASGQDVAMPMTPTELSRFISTEIVKWTRLTKEAGIEPE